MAEMADIPWTIKIRLAYVPNTMATDELAKHSIRTSTAIVNDLNLSK